jgi:hypothetical protein
MIHMAIGPYIMKSERVEMKEEDGGRVDFY